MADRTVSITLTAEVGGFVSRLKTARMALKDTMRSLGKTAQENRAAWEGTGRAVGAFGGAVVGAFAVATRAAMQWESAWTGVLKTVDGTSDQLARLEGDLRHMATELPATHTEIAAVAEAAGQLGVHVDDVAAFSRVMLDLGETTNMSAEEAATQLARFMNIMGTSQSEVSNLGAAVVGLGNNFATTEGEIVALSMRLAGAGRQAGLSEGEVLGLATAMSSVGIEAEAGGSAMSLTMKRIAREVETGGEKLDLFARVAGMSAQEFSAAWREDAAGTLATFIGGLAETERMGMSTIGVLTELGVTGIRESDALLRLSSAQEVLNGALSMGNDEYERNTALVLEASKRYETAESRVKMARNALNDAAIDIGAVVLPAVAGLADAVAGAASWFSSLPTSVQSTATRLSALAGGVSLAAGGFLLLVPRLMDTIDAMRAFQSAYPRVAGGLTRIGKAAVVATAISSVATAIASIAESSYKKGVSESLEDIAAAIIDLDQTADSAALDNLFRKSDGSPLWEDVQDLESAVGRLFNKSWEQAFNDWGSSLMSSIFHVEGGWEMLTGAVARYDEQLAQFVAAGRSDLAAKGFAAFRDAALAQGASLAEVEAYFPQYQEALKGVENDSRLAADAADDQRSAIDRLADTYYSGTASIEDYAEALRDLTDAQREAAGIALDERRALREYEAALDAAREKVKENGKELDISTEKGRENQAALDEIASSAWEVVDALVASGASGEDARAVMERAREDFVSMARRMGMARDEAEDLADALRLIPDEVDVQAQIATEAAQRELDAWIRRNGGRRVRVHVDTVQGTSYQYGPGAPIARSSGGKLPGPPSSKDNMLIHAASGEWVINARSSQKYDSLLRAINEDRLPGFATGGRVGGSSGRDALEARRVLREMLRDLERDLKRGNVTSRVTGSMSGAWSFVDEIRDAASRDGLSTRQRNRLKEIAKEAAREFKALHKEAGKVAKQLDRATERMESLKQISDGVANRLRSEQSLGDSLNRTDSYGRTAKVTARDLVRNARAKAAKIKAFSGKLKKLAQMGASGAILEEIAQMGSEEGSIVADALLAGGKSAVKQLNEAYADIDKYAKRSGQYVTEGFEEGGLKAAKALVKELKAQQKEIDDALKKAAKSAAEEFAKVLENASKGKTGTGKSSSSASSSAPPVKGSAAAGSVFSGPWSVEVTLTTDKKYAAAVVRSGVQEVARTDRAILRKAVGL